MQFIKCLGDNGLPIIVQLSIVESVCVVSNFDVYEVKVNTNIEWQGQMVRYTVSRHTSKEEAIAEIDRIYELLNSKE